MNCRRASTGFGMSDSMWVGQDESGDIIVDSLKGFLGILASTWRLVVFVIPPLLRLGLIDRSGCVVLGAVIGIVVAVSSNRNGLRQSDNET